MRDYVNLSVLANWVSMLRAEVDGALWLSDDDSEARFYERCAHESGRVVAAPGTAVQLLNSLIDRRIEGVVATVRSDIDGSVSANVFRPSLGDIASMLLASTTAYRAIVNIGGSPWLTAAEREIGPIRDRAIWIARIVSGLRETCLSQGIAPLDTNRISDYVRWDTFEIAWDRVDAILTERGLKPGSIAHARKIPAASSIAAGLMECDGMDAIRVIALATHYFHPRGISAYRIVDPAELLSMLQVSYELAELEGDPMYWQMRRWERVNIRYPLLRQWRSLDPLGVLWDQRYWEPDLAVVIELLGPGEPLVAVKTDLDNFKAVNDSLGHTIGDEAIRLYCRIFKKIFEYAGDVYRRGGDEVIALAPGLAHDRARELAEELRSTTEEEFRKWSSERGLASPPTASIGLVLAGADQSPAEVVRLLDEALLQAKAQGKNCVVHLTLSPTSSDVLGKTVEDGQLS